MKPLLFLIFNRPDFTKQVFAEIRKAKPKKLYIAADAPRTKEEKNLCLQTRKIIDQVDWDCEIKTLFREKTLGCKYAISTAIDWFFKHEEMGIILEDDCVPSASFFSFSSELLERYKNDMRIMMISGNNFQDGHWRGEASYYFSQNFYTWGWATWRRAWNLMDLEMSSVHDFRKKSMIDEIFTDENIALAWRYAFALAQKEKVTAWDYPWVFSILLQNGLSIVPNKNLVKNIGFGENSTHTSNKHSKYSNVTAEDFDGHLIHPSLVYPNVIADAHNAWCDYQYPIKKKMSLKYRWKRMRKARRFQIKLEDLYT